MIPIALDPGARLAIAGNGSLALRRLRALQAAGADVCLYATVPVPELVEAAGQRLLTRLPYRNDLQALHALWIVDLPADIAAALTAQARALKVLVNVEDRPELCDFHSVAELRRGDLLLTVSTGGAAPGLAGSIRRYLEARFAPEWAERVAEVAGLRAVWRDDGLGMAEVACRVDALVAARGWLPSPIPPDQAPFAVGL